MFLPVSDECEDEQFEDILPEPGEPDLKGWSTEQAVAQLRRTLNEIEGLLAHARQRGDDDLEIDLTRRIRDLRGRLAAYQALLKSRN